MPRLPEQLLNSLKQDERIDIDAFVEAHDQNSRITSVRLNPFKPSSLQLSLGAQVPWYPLGYYLEQRPSFTLDPLFHAGAYYVQEAGSMFIAQALSQTLDLGSPVSVLDLCGAPGGKSTLVNALLSNDSLLVSNEIIKSRATVLAQNLSRWGTSNTIVTNNDAAKYAELSEVFDAIIVDAPCSGSGLFRKQPEAINEWSESAVLACANRQQVILGDVLPALKPGGVLVYSTCSYSRAENEDIVAWLTQHFAMEYVPLTIAGQWGIVDTGSGYRFYPHLTASEGFFCAVLRKVGGVTPGEPYRKKKRDPGLSTAERSVLTQILPQLDAPVLKRNGLYHLLSPLAAEFFHTFEKQLYFKKAGIAIGEIKGKDLVPHQELAWSAHLNLSVPQLELEHEQALAYLRRQPLTAEGPAGLCLVTHNGLGLGWAKVLPNRINNYYPQELRILNAS